MPQHHQHEDAFGGSPRVKRMFGWSAAEVRGFPPPLGRSMPAPVGPIGNLKLVHRVSRVDSMSHGGEQVGLAVLHGSP